MPHYPTKQNRLDQWRWLLANPFSRRNSRSLIQDLETSLREPHQAHTWFAKVFSWWQNRLQGDLNADARLSEDLAGRLKSVAPSGPDPFWLPFPLGSRDPGVPGRLAFVTCRQMPHNEGVPQPSAADHRTLAQITKAVSLTPHARIALILPNDLDGAASDRPGFESNSHALAMLIAHLSNLLGMRVPPDVLATGAWAEQIQEFIAVPPETLTSKVAVLREWRYTRLLVIQGQSMPAESPHWLTTRPIPANPKKAAYAIAHELWRMDPAALDAKLASLQGLRSHTNAIGAMVRRDKIQERLHLWFDASQQDCHIHWLWGVRGVGKTEAVRAFCASLHQDIRQVHCDDAGQPRKRDDFYVHAAATLAECFGIDEPMELSEPAPRFCEVARCATGRAARTRPLFVIDAFDHFVDDEPKQLLDDVKVLAGLGMRVLVCSQSPPPSEDIPRTECLLGFSEDDIHSLLALRLGGTATARGMAKNILPANGIKWHADPLACVAQMIERTTGGLPIHVDLICKIISDTGSWIVSDTPFVPLAVQYIDKRLSKIPFAREVLGVLASVQADLDVASLKGIMKRIATTCQDSEIDAAVLGVSFVVTSRDSHDHQYLAISHNLYSEAVRESLGVQRLLSVAAAINEWCADLEQHMAPYALRYGPHHLATSSHLHHQQRLQALARNNELPYKVHSAFPGDVNAVAGFAYHAMAIAQNAGHSMVAAEFCVRHAVARSLVREHFNPALIASHNSPVVTRDLIANALRDHPLEQKFAACIAALQHAIAGVESNEILLLIKRFFGHKEARVKLSEEYRDACLPLLAGVMCRLAGGLSEIDLDLVGSMYRNNVAPNKLVTLARAVIYQSTQLDNEQRARVLRTAIQMLGDPKAKGYPTHDMISALIKTGDAQLAEQLFFASADAGSDKWSWWAVDILDLHALQRHASNAASLCQRASLSIDLPSTSQEFVAAAACLAAGRAGHRHISRRDSSPSNIAAGFEQIIKQCLCSQVGKDHKPLTLIRIARFAVMARWSGASRLIAMACNPKDAPRVVSRLSTYLNVNRYLRQMLHADQIEECAKSDVNIGSVAKTHLEQITRSVFDPLHWQRVSEYCEDHNLDCRIIALVERGGPTSSLEAISSTLRTDAQRVASRVRAMIANGLVKQEREGNSDSPIVFIGSRKKDELDPVQIIKETKNNLAKSWADLGDIERADQVLFAPIFMGASTEPVHTVDTERGQTLAEIAKQALDQGKPWEDIIRRRKQNAKYRLTIISRILGRLCENSRYDEAMMLACREFQQKLSEDGTRKWGPELLKGAERMRLRATNANRANEETGVAWQDGAQLRGAIDPLEARIIVYGARLDPRIKFDQEKGEHFASVGHCLDLFGDTVSAERAWAEAMHYLSALKRKAQYSFQGALAGELLEKRCLRTWDEHDQLLCRMLLESAECAKGPKERPKVWDAVYNAARSAIMNAARLPYIKKLRNSVRTQFDTHGDGPARCIAVDALLLSADGRHVDAEQHASQIMNVDVLEDAFGDIAKSYLLAGRINDVCRLAHSRLTGKQIKQLVCMILAPTMQSERRMPYLQKLLPAASRSLDSAAWCAAALVVLDRQPSNDQVALAVQGMVLCIRTQRSVTPRVSHGASIATVKASGNDGVLYTAADEKDAQESCSALAEQSAEWMAGVAQNEAPRRRARKSVVGRNAGWLSGE